MQALAEMPHWYIAVTALITIFHVARGAIGQTHLNPARKSLKRWWQQAIVLYIPDALLHVFSTVVGATALWLAYKLSMQLPQPLEATSVFAVLSLGVFGLAGIVGVLATMLSSGNIPSLR